MTTDTIDLDAGDTLAAVARLLRHAAVRAWAQAEVEGPRSPLHLLGWGSTPLHARRWPCCLPAPTWRGTHRHRTTSPSCCAPPRS